MNKFIPTNFVQYDPETGDILCSGTTDLAALEALIEAGEPFLISDGNFLVDEVDLKTKKIRRREKPLPGGEKVDHVPVRAGKGSPFGGP